jgi:hypothetical protein
VYVSVAQLVHGGCRFLDPHGRLGRPRRCSKPILLRARGTAHWRLKLNARGLPRGRYRVTVRAFDTAGNREAPTRHANTTVVTLP